MHPLRTGSIRLFCVLAVLCAALPVVAESGASPRRAAGQASSAAVEQPAFPVMPAPGKKVWITKDSYLIYGFDKRPKLGMLIMKVEVFATDGRRDTSLVVLGDAGMPSMKGAHETGVRPFQLSKKGAYLFPVNIVMPGDWEVRITIERAGAVIFQGSHQFDV